MTRERQKPVWLLRMLWYTAMLALPLGLLWVTRGAEVLFEHWVLIWAAATATGLGIIAYAAGNPLWNALLYTVAAVFAAVICTGLVLTVWLSSQDLVATVASSAFAVLWVPIGLIFGALPRKRALLLVPTGRAVDLPKWIENRVTWIADPDLSGRRIDGVVLDPDVDLEARWVRALTGPLQLVPVYHPKTLIREVTGRVALEDLSREDLVDLEIPLQYRILKRALDLFLVLAAAPIVLPICLLVAACIRLESSGPALYRQNRVGYRGRTFSILKFRSMCQGADAGGPEFASKEDSRITAVGKVLRVLRIDELPQLWNVLRGDMSIIGPRPEQVPFARQLEEEVPAYAYRHAVRPGLTGWAQVIQGYAGSLSQVRLKLEYDLYYVRRHSIWLDLEILARTIPTVLTGFGAR